MFPQLTNDQIETYRNNRYFKHLHKKIIRGPLTKSMKNFNKGTLVENIAKHTNLSKDPIIKKLRGQRKGERAAYATMAQTEHPTLKQRTLYEYYRQRRGQRWRKRRIRQERRNAWYYNTKKFYKKGAYKKQKLDWEKEMKIPKTPKFTHKPQQVLKNENRRSRKMHPVIHDDPYRWGLNDRLWNVAGLAKDVAQFLGVGNTTDPILKGVNQAQAIAQGLSKIPKIIYHTPEKKNYDATWDLNRNLEEYDTHYNKNDITPKTIRNPEGSLTTYWKYDKNNMLSRDFNNLVENHLFPYNIYEGLYKFHHGNSTIDYTPKDLNNWLDKSMRIMSSPDKWSGYFSMYNILGKIPYVQKNFEYDINKFAKNELGWNNLNKYRILTPEGNVFNSPDVYDKEWDPNNDKNLLTWDERYENV